MSETEPETEEEKKRRNMERINSAKDRLKWRKLRVASRMAAALNKKDKEDENEANEMNDFLQSIHPMPEEKKEKGLSTGYIEKILYRTPKGKNKKNLTMKGNLKIWGNEMPKLGMRGKLTKYSGGKKYKKRKTRRKRRKTKRKKTRKKRGRGERKRTKSKRKRNK